MALKMKNFLKNSKIYRNFRMEELRSKIFGNKVIGYDEKNDEVILDDTSSRIYKDMLTLIFQYCCLLMGTPFNYTKALLNVYDVSLILTVFINYVYVTIFYFNAQKIRKWFCDLILNFEVIDYYLGKYHRFSRTKRTINYVIPFITILFFTTFFVFFLLGLLSFFFYPTSRAAAVILILLLFYLPYGLYLILARLLFVDRLNVFNDFILELCQKSRGKACGLCTKNSLNATLCFNHTIRHVDRIYKLFTILLNITEKIHHLVITCSASFLLILGPVYMLIIMNSIMGKELPIDLVTCKLLHAAGIIYAIPNFAYAIAIENSASNLSSISRRIHKLYLMSVIERTQGNSTLILLSIETIFPKYQIVTVVDLYVINANNMISVPNSLIKGASLLASNVF